MSNPQNPADGQHVVIQNGQRATKTMSQEEAQQEAQRLNRISESQGQQVPEEKRAQVKQNICG